MWALQGCKSKNQITISKKINKNSIYSFSPAYLELGCRDSSLSGDAKISLSTEAFSSSASWTPRGSQANQEMWLLLHILGLPHSGTRLEFPFREPSRRRPEEFL